MSKRGGARSFGRVKRDITFVTMPIEEYSVDDIHSMPHREKRDTLTHVENVMTNIQNKLVGLQVSY